MKRYRSDVFPVTMQCTGWTDFSNVTLVIEDFPDVTLTIGDTWGDDVKVVDMEVDKVAD